MRLEPLYRVRFTYPESWAIGLDGGWQQMFFIAEGRCEEFGNRAVPRRELPPEGGRGRPLPARLPGCHRDRRRGHDHGGVARVRPCLPAGTPPDRRVRPGPDLVIDVAELIWEPIAD